jgi:hypothetical protein
MIEHRYSSECKQLRDFSKHYKEETRAAALLAEYHALHEYRSRVFSARPKNLIAASFWMEQTGHSGQIPFAGDPNYKVKAKLNIKMVRLN